MSEAAYLASFPDGGIAVVFGATGGIGGAATSALRADPNFGAVEAFCRSSTPPMDLLDEESIARAVAFATAKGELRLVIDATGFLHDSRQSPEKNWRQLDPAKMARSFAINAIGPALIIKHVLPKLPKSGKSVFVTLSARVGSIGDNRLGGWYAYRASKAALNQIVRTASVELARQSPEAICLAYHPGTVTTSLSRPFAATGLEIHDPEAAARNLLNVVEGLTPRENGGFLDWRGQTIPW